MLWLRLLFCSVFFAAGAIVRGLSAIIGSAIMPSQSCNSLPAGTGRTRLAVASQLSRSIHAFFPSLHNGVLSWEVPT